MANKIDVVTGAYQLIRISGLTVKALSEEITLGVQVLDDYMGELRSSLDTGYIQPLDYGQSDPNDFSGLTPDVVGPIKKLLARELVTFFGKEAPMSLVLNAEAGMRSLEQTLVCVQPAQNPATLPIGSGNEWDYRSDKFYPEPNNDDGAENHFETDVFQLPIDWSSYVEGDTLASVTYDPEGGLVLTDKAIIDNTSVVTISFSRRGQFTLCVIAEKASTGEKTTEKFIYNSVACHQTGLTFN